MPYEVNTRACKDWGKALLRAYDEGWDIYSFLEIFMNADDLQDYADNLDLQGKGQAYIATMFPGIKNPDAKQYAEVILEWTGYIYCYWCQSRHVTPAYIWKKADINKMERVWHVYHTIMNTEAVINNLENEVDE